MRCISCGERGPTSARSRSPSPLRRSSWRRRAPVVGALLIFLAAIRPQMASAGQVPMLDVPYVSQSEALCGGAAAAMVQRYWGFRAAAEDMAHLIDQEAEGIATGTLVEALQLRGWTARALTGDADFVKHHLADGRPLIALIEARPGRLHYVVILGWADGRVVFHDPATRPTETLAEAEFDRRWAATRRWTLLALPGTEAPTGTAPFEHTAKTPPRDGHHCAAEIARGVRAAQRREFVEAEAALSDAGTKCPGSPHVFRELAGLRAAQERWSEAVLLAQHAVALDPKDRHAWHIIATGRFVEDDTVGALAAWNARGEPFIDLIRIEGLAQTRYTAVQSALRLDAGSLLSVDRLRLARRRLQDLPALSATHVRYTPLAGGLAHVDVAVVERPVIPRGRATFAALGIQSLTERSVDTRVSSPTGGGERWDVGVRWWQQRPKVSLGFAAKVGAIPGVVQVVTFWERQTYAGGIQARRRATVGASDWITPDLRWSASGGFDSFSDPHSPSDASVRGSDHVTVNAALERRDFNDRVAMMIEGGRWWPTTGRARFASGRVAIALRSSAASDRIRAVGQAGWHRVTENAPLGVWPGAGAGHGRDVLLRAHPLLDDGVVRGVAFGRTLIHASGELLVPVKDVRPVRLDLAGFMDVARPFRPSADLHVDVGVGVRVGVPGTDGVFRADIARGLRDGRTVFSVGLQRQWTGW